MCSCGQAHPTGVGLDTLAQDYANKPPIDQPVKALTQEEVTEQIKQWAKINNVVVYDNRLLDVKLAPQTSNDDLLGYVDDRGIFIMIGSR